MQSPFTWGPAPLQESVSLREATTGAPPIRILHCIPTLDIGGAETQLRLLATRQARQGLDVAIFGRIADTDVAALRTQRVSCFPIAAHGNHNPAIPMDLLRVVRQWRPTIIQTWLTQMDILGGMIARTFGIPWIVAERSSPMNYASSAKNRLRQYLGRGAVVVANAPHGLEVWPNHDNSRVIGNGIDFSVLTSRTGNVLREQPPFADHTSLVSVSRLVPEKNVDTLIAAVAIARPVVPDLHLVIVGDGPEKARLENLVRSRGLGAAVSFAGYRSPAIDWIRAADIFVSASLYEGHPNAVTEAAALGVPTVLSDIPMHTSLMGDGARYAGIHDAEAFAGHIVTLARDEAARAILVEQSGRIVGRFDVDAIVIEYAALYSELVDAARRRRSIHAGRNR